MGTRCSPIQPCINGFSRDSTKAAIGCGGLLALLRLVLISPAVPWMIKAVGVMLIVMGVLMAILDIGARIFLPRRRDP